MSTSTSTRPPPPLLRKGTSALGRVPKRAAAGSYCDHSGWGAKQGSIIKNWKRRYFVLKGLELIYFAECSPGGKGLDEKGRLKVAAVEFTPDFHDALLVMGTLKNQKMVVQFEGGDRACKEWMHKIQSAIQSARSDASAASSNRTSSNNQQRSSATTMEGWLFKEGQNFKTWKKRYMTLTGRVLQYAEAQGEPPKGEVRVQSVNINKSRKFALDIYSDNNRILRIAGATFETIEAWDHALARALRRAPCFGESFSDQPAPFLGMDSLNDTDCDGWLYMCGHRSLSWKKRYFTLKQHVLQYADHPGENSKGEGSVIDLKLGFKHCQLEIKLDDGKWISVAMDSDDDFDKWLRALCEVLDRSPTLLERVTAQAPSSRFMFNVPSAMSSAMRSSDVGRSSQGSRGSDLQSSESTVRKKGWLRKEGQRMKSWKRRYFVLEGSRLHYYENIGMKTLKGGGDVQSVVVSEKQANGLSIHFESGRVLHVVGDSAHDIRAWMESLQGGSGVVAASSSSAFAASSGAGSFNDSGSSLPRSSTMDSSGSDSTTVADALHATSFGQGWLLKQGSNFKTWKQRYFVLDGRALSYAKGVGEETLGSSLVERVLFSDVRPFALEVTLSSGRVMTLVASVDDEFMMWCRAFKACFELRQRVGSVLPAPMTKGTVSDHDDDDDAEDREYSVDDEDDDDDDIAILDDDGETDDESELPRVGPTLLQKMHSVMDEIEDVDGLSISDDPSARELTAQFHADMVVCSGWLRKQGGHIKSWKERFFTLYGTTMRYFKTENGPFIGGATIVHVLILHTRKHSFEMTLDSGRKMAVLAESESEAERWISALRRAITVAREEKAAAAAASEPATAAPLPARPKITRALGKSSLLQARSASSGSSSDASTEVGELPQQAPVYAV